jgi:hypothetical protein
VYLLIGGSLLGNTVIDLDEMLTTALSVASADLRNRSILAAEDDRRLATLGNKDAGTIHRGKPIVIHIFDKGVDAEIATVILDTDHTLAIMINGLIVAHSESSSS